MQPIEKLREYAHTVCSQIRWKKAHDAVSEEIRNHLMDQRDAYMQEGAKEEEATDRAIAEMGDPVGVGARLDRIHRPRPQWGMLLLTLVLVLLGIYLQMVVQDDIVNRYRIPPGTWYQIRFVLAGAAVLLIAYFSDFTLIGKYPKLTYCSLLAAFAVAFPVSPQVQGTAYYASFCPLLFPVAFSGMVYAMRGKGYPGIAACVAACFFPAFLAMQVPTLDGMLLIMAGGAVILGIAIAQNWFISKRRQSFMLAYIPFLGALALLAFGYLRTPYAQMRIEAFLHPERDPNGGGYAATVIQSLLENAKWLGGGTLPQRFAESARFPLPAIHTDFLLTYIIFKMGWLAFGLIVALLLLFIIWSFKQCLKQKSMLGQLVSVSVLLTFTFQTIHYTVYNLGFVLMGPLSLPLLSFGGVALAVNLGLIGLMLSVFRCGDMARDRKPPSAAAYPFITWHGHKLIIDFGRRNRN